MERIEIFGPPGVGKTTFCKVLTRTLKREGVPVIDSCRLPLIHLAETGRTQYLGMILRSSLLPASVLNRLMLDRMKRSFTARVLTKELDNEEGWQKFVRVWLREIGKVDSHSGLCLVRARLFGDSVAAANFVALSNMSGIVILDEGLAQCGFGLAFSGGSESAVKEYFEQMPLPRVLIKADADREIIFDRLQARDGDRGRYLAEIDRAKEVGSICEKIAKTRGCEIIAFDGNESFERQAQQLRGRIWGRES